MDRLLYNDLLSWMRAPRRKPVLVDGARQTGKTHLIEQIFGARQFRKVHKLDFNLAPGLASVFADGLAPRTIVDNIEVSFNEPVDLARDLLSWMRAPRRKPVLVDGARQTGKTHLIEQIFGARQFRKVHKLDFNLAPGLASVFADGLAPRTIVDNIEVSFNEPVDLARDLIFFDEVGDCQPALDSLKYFAEQRDL